MIPDDVIHHLASKGVISDADKHEIETVCKNRGNIEGMDLLLDRMQCHLSPKEWYFEFLSVLQEREYNHLLTNMEDDFIICPSEFAPTSSGFNSTGKRLFSCIERTNLKYYLFV